MIWAMVMVVAYVVMQKWDLVKQYLPANLRQALSQLGANRQAQVVQFQSLALFCCALYMVPFDLLGIPLNVYFWNGAVWTCLASSVTTIISNYGVPPVKEGWQACQGYLANISQSPEFHWLFFNMIWISANPFFLVLLILARRSFWIVFKASQKQTAMLEKHPRFAQIKPMFEMLDKKEEDILKYATVAEIFLGFYLLIMLIGPERQLLTTFMYWNFLRIRFHTPRTRKNQDQAWGYVKEKTDPILTKIPGSSKVIDLAKSYFLKPM